MTMFDNPKFPDQLSALGGDQENYRLPWEKAAENPRSYFGITRVVNSLLYNVSAFDLSSFAMATFVLLAVGLAACYVPARRAARVDAAIVLRTE